MNEVATTAFAGRGSSVALIALHTHQERFGHVCHEVMIVFTELASRTDKTFRTSAIICITLCSAMVGGHALNDFEPSNFDEHKARLEDITNTVERFSLLSNSFDFILSRIW
jgi:hypothetical protein